MGPPSSDRETLPRSGRGGSSLCNADAGRPRPESAAAANDRWPVRPKNQPAGPEEPPMAPVLTEVCMVRRQRGCIDALRFTLTIVVIVGFDILLGPTEALLAAGTVRYSTFSRVM